MAVKFLILVAALALTNAALVKRDAPTPLEDLQKHAMEFQKVISEGFSSLTSSKNTEDVNKALKDGSETVLQQVTSFSASLQNVLADASGKAKEALEQTKANLDRTAEELRKQHPEVEQQANELKEKLQAALQNTVQESQKLAKELAANLDQTGQKLGPKVQDAYNDFVKQAQEVQKKVHEAATKQ